MSEWEDFRDKLLADEPQTNAEYERLGPLYDLISQVIRLRHERGLTQEEVALRMGTRQPAIARFESGRVEPSFRFLSALAEALDARLIVQLEPQSDGHATKVNSTTVLASEAVLGRDWDRPEEDEAWADL
jgi:transcriptional regulator with XRE-family HTH domain